MSARSAAGPALAWLTVAPRRPRGIAPAALLLVMALLAGGCANGTGGGRPQEVAVQAAPPHDGAGVRRAWAPRTSPPLGRISPMVVSAGRWLLLWGGGGASDRAEYADGALYDTATGRWTPVPSAPIAARSSAGSAWTGREVLIWGGGAGRAYGDGAALDPDTSTWRPLPAAPLSPRVPAITAWTGREFVVWGDADRFAAARDGAAYDPHGNRWRRIAAAPAALNQAEALWTGSELVVLGARLDGGNQSRTRTAVALAYDPDSNAWRTLRAPRLSPQASSLALAGRTIIAWDYELRAVRYERSTNQWAELPDLPLRASECYPETLRLGAVVLAWYCGRGALYAEGSRGWKAVPAAPGSRAAGVTVRTTGNRMFALVISRTGSRRLWEYAASPTAARGPFLLVTLPSLGTVSWTCGAGRYPWFALRYHSSRRFATTRVEAFAGGRLVARRTVQPGDAVRLPFSAARKQRLLFLQATGAGTLRAEVAVDFVPNTPVIHCWDYAPPAFVARVQPRR